MAGTPVKLLRKRLDAAGVVEHLRDLAQRATQLEVRIQQTTGAISDPTTESLDVLARRLAAGDLVGLQISFFADDDWWRDTLLRIDDNFRLVRMREGS